MAEHILKVGPAYMDALIDGSKTFEVRRNDRAFQRGDTLILWEYDGKSGCDRWDCPDHKPRATRRTVTFIYSGDPSLRDLGGIVPGYAVLGLGLGGA